LKKRQTVGCGHGHGQGGCQDGGSGGCSEHETSGEVREENNGMNLTEILPFGGKAPAKFQCHVLDFGAQALL